MVLEGLGGSGEEARDPDPQNVPRLQRPLPRYALGGLGRDAQFLAQLTHQSTLGALTWFDLAAGSLGYCKLSLRYSSIPEPRT
ncbi:hypothetical protein GCM10022206_72930 [Streptomyces chiangmaiensis]